MNRISTRHRVVVLAAVLLALGAGSAGATGQVGETAAGFRLQSTTGKIHELSDYDGQVKFLFMFGHG
jgi:hypothetical protein